jgi:hypothetical protein
MDLFENPTAEDVTASVRYHSNMGDNTGRTATTSGGADLTGKDWGIVTAGQGETSRPAVVHVFASPEAKSKPTFQFDRNNDDLYCSITIKVPARKAAALCMFEAQRSSLDAGTKFLKDFQPTRELQGLPPALRRVVINLASQASVLGEIELKRSDEADLIILRTGDEILGRILNPQYAVRAFFGELKIPAGEVVGIVSVSAENNRVHLALAGGQVVGGELLEQVTVKLAGGTELSIPAKGLVQAAYRVTPEKPAEIALTSSLVALRTGEQLAVDESALALEFLSAQGTLVLSARDLQAIETDTPAGGLHRALFRNGSVLAGLLTAEKIPLKLRLALPLEVSPAQVKRFQFAGPPLAEDQGLTALTLRNSDVLVGRFADQKWTVTGKFGDVAVACADIAEAEFPAESLGQVRLTLRNGTKIGGKVVQEYVGFKIEPGPLVKVYVGHLAAAKGGEPPEKPAASPGAGAATAPAATRPSAALPPAGAVRDAPRALPLDRPGSLIHWEATVTKSPPTVRNP